MTQEKTEVDAALTELLRLSRAHWEASQVLDDQHRDAFAFRAGAYFTSARVVADAFGVDLESRADNMKEMEVEVGEQ